MAKKNTTKEIIKLVSNYGELIKKNGISFDHLILFGSYAKNLERKSSDIDVCVVSDTFTDEHKAQVNLSKLTWNFDTRIEPHPISLFDYSNNSTPFINEIRKYGILVS